MSSIDRLDAEILAKLTVNARAGTAEIARELGVSRATVQIRLQRLERDGVLLGFRPIINVAALGVPVQALVSLEIDQRLMSSVLRFLQAIPAVLEVQFQAGREDLMARVATESLDRHRQLMDEMIAIEGVRKTTTTFTMPGMAYRVLPLLEQMTKDAGWGRSTPAPMAP